MTARLARPPLTRSLGVAALPLFTGALLAGVIPSALAQDTASSDWSGGPRYSHFDAGYQWTDVLYAVKQEGGQHGSRDPRDEPLYAGEGRLPPLWAER